MLISDISARVFACINICHVRTVIFSFRCSIRGVRWIVNIVQTLFTIVWAVSIIGAIRALLASVSVVAFITFGENRFKHQNRSPPFHIHNVYFIKDTPHNCAKTRRVIFGDPKFRERAQFKRTVCTRNKPRYATFIRLRARYKFASANSVQQC